MSHSNPHFRFNSEPVPIDKELEITGPEGMKIRIDFDDVNHSVILALAHQMTRLLNRYWSESVVARQNEQHLIDIMFEIALTLTMPSHREEFQKMTREQIADWVANQLKQCGFTTIPMGASWGMLR